MVAKLAREDLPTAPPHPLHQLPLNRPPPSHPHPHPRPHPHPPHPPTTPTRPPTTPSTPSTPPTSLLRHSAPTSKARRDHCSDCRSPSGQPLGEGGFSHILATWARRAKVAASSRSSSRVGRAQPSHRRSAGSRQRKRMVAKTAIVAITSSCSFELKFDLKLV